MFTSYACQIQYTKITIPSIINSGIIPPIIESAIEMPSTQPIINKPIPLPVLPYICPIPWNPKNPAINAIKTADPGFLF